MFANVIFFSYLCSPIVCTHVQARLYSVRISVIKYDEYDSIR